MGICYESEYLLRNTFSQINEKKLTKPNESKMEAIPLSKRRPYMQKLGGKRLKNNFYEEKTFSNLLKKFELYGRVYIKLQDPIFFQKNHKD